MSGGKARAVNNLDKDVLNAIDRVLAAPKELRETCGITFHQTIELIKDEFGPLASLPNKSKQDLAARLSTIGLQKSDANMAVAYGLFLAAVHLAASAQPGQNAAFALSKTKKYLQELAARVDEARRS